MLCGERGEGVSGQSRDMRERILSEFLAVFQILQQVLLEARLCVCPMMGSPTHFSKYPLFCLI